MVAYLPLLVLLAVVVFFLIRAEFANDRSSIYRFKPVASAILVGLLLLSLTRPDFSRPEYTLAMLAGLVLCYGGDIALMFLSPKAFRIGLVLFLLGHVGYAIALTAFSGFVRADIISGVVLLALALVLFLYLKAGLGDMKVPVIFYILIISFMVNRAVSVSFGDYFTPVQAVVIAAGAVLFYVSDVILAAARFRTQWRYNRISLAFYYSGQACLALSAGMFGM